VGCSRKIGRPALDLSSGKKCCPGCGEEKPLTDFYRRKITKKDPSGYRSSCKSCDIADGTIRMATWRLRNLERDNAGARRRSKAPTARAKHAAYMRTYTKRPEQRPILRDRWRLKRAILRAETYKDGVIQAATQIEGKFTRADWLALLKEFDHACAYCGTETKLSLEHLMPLSRDGKTEVGNIVPACIPCNSSKRDQTLEEFVPNRAAEIRERARLN